MGTHVQLVSEAIGQVATFLSVIESTGTFATSDSLKERELQKELLTVLRTLRTDVTEGAEVAGGETDVIIGQNLVIENKVRDVTADPFDAGVNYNWQARRYGFAVIARVVFTIVAYKPTDESKLLPMTERVRVLPATNERFASVRFVLPWGLPSPHDARAPKASSRPSSG